MVRLNEYLKPTSVAEALTMLQDGHGSRMLLAGGTWLIGQLQTGALPDVEGVVDLGGLELDGVTQTSDGLTIGAMCTLTDFVQNSIVRALAGGVLVQAAHNEGPVNLRNAATLGGTIARAEYDSELYAALLAMNAHVTVVDLDGAESVIPLSELDYVTGIITSVSIPTAASRGGHARIARTPSDRCIVAAVAVEPSNGDDVRIALCGVAQKPVLRGTPPNPPDDIRGSAEYRTSMIDIVVERALTDLEKADRHAA